MSDIAGPYSSLKILHHPERIAQLRRGEQIVPTQLQIILSDLCNHSCSFCSYRWDGYSSSELFTLDAPLAKFGHNNPVRMMPTDKAKEIVDDCVEMGVEAVQFSVHGEERIPVLTSDGKLATVRIGDFVDGLLGGALDDKYHEKDVSDCGFKTFAIDDDGTLILDDLVAIYRHPAIEPLYEVVLHDGRTACVTASHSINVVENGAIQRKPVKDIVPGDLVACATWSSGLTGIPATNRSFAAMPSRQEWSAKQIVDEVRESPELYRLLGYYTAEGSVTSRSLIWVFGNGPRENFYRDDVRGCIRAVFGVEGVSHKNGEAVALHCVKAQTLFLETFQAGGIQKNRQIPWIVWQATRDNQLEYLRGLFSGDGNFRSTKDSRGYNRNSLHLKTCNSSLAQEVASLLRMLGARCTIVSGVSKQRVIEGRTLLESDYYSVNIYDAASLYVLRPVLEGLMASPQYADSVYSLPGKPHSKYHAFGVDSVLIPVKTVRRRDDLGLPMVYDVTVRKTHRFLLSNGIGCANTGGGEITVHPDHVQIMKYSLDKGLDCALVSNGELFREGHIENLLRFKWVRFSLDAGTQETYGSIRGIPASRMNRVLDNIAALVAARHKQIESGDECDLIIGIGFVVTKENYKEVVQCAELAKTLGVDNMRISAVFQPDDDEYFSEIHEEAFRLCRQAESLSDSKFVVFNNYSERVQDLADKHPDYSFCGYQQLVSYVGADLNVYRCCVTSYSKKGAIGSLKNQRFRDLWESDAKKRDFESFDARGCPRCMFNRKNKTILYALDTKPRHANFV